MMNLLLPSEASPDLQIVALRLSETLNQPPTYEIKNYQAFFTRGNNGNVTFVYDPKIIYLASSLELYNFNNLEVYTIGNSLSNTIPSNNAYFNVSLLLAPDRLELKNFYFARLNDTIATFAFKFIGYKITLV